MAVDNMLTHTSENLVFRTGNPPKTTMVLKDGKIYDNEGQEINGGGGLFRIEITFGESLVGKSFTVTGTGFSYTGTVPGGLVATVGVSRPNTVYTVACDGNSATVETTSYFGVYPVMLVTLSDYTWAQIAAIVAAGNASSYWNVGDTKDITLTTGETLTLCIYGFDHDDLASGGKAGITFGMKNLMATTIYTSSTDNGYIDSELFGWLRDTLLPSLPAELQSVIKTVNKSTSAGGQSSTIRTDEMKVFLFSEVECFGATTYSFAGEGAQYPVFTDTTSRIKYLSNGTGSASVWWLRSPRSAHRVYPCVVLNNGNAGGTGPASGNNGVCFGFCI